MSYRGRKKITKKISRLPKTPGIYYFKNSKDEIIYIGKAANLYQRVRSYFSPSLNREQKIEKMTLEIADIAWEKTASEIEALLREAQAIKKIKPLYNVLMRDDKNYFYAAFTKNSFPKIIITHQPINLNKKNQAVPNQIKSFIGPFTNGRALKEVLKSIRRIFPFCTCKKRHKNPCVSSEIGLCPGYCCLKTNKKPPRKKAKKQKKEYQLYQKNIKRFLAGRIRPLIKDLKEKMLQKAQLKKFEEAEMLRKKIIDLQNILLHKKIISIQEKNFDKKLIIEDQKSFLKYFRLKAIPKRLEAYDISNIQGKMATGSMIVFGLAEKTTSKKSVIFEPQNKEYRRFRIQTKDTPDDLAMLKEVLKRRLRHKNNWPMPDIILLDGGRGQIKAAKQVMAQNKLHIPLLALAKSSKKLYTISYIRSKTDAIKVISLKTLPIQVSRFFYSLNRESHRFAINYHKTLRKKTIKSNY